MYRFFIPFLFIALATGCAKTVKVSHTSLADPYSDAQSASLVPTKVLVHALPDSQHKLHEHSGLIIVGMMSDWKIDLHSTLPEAVGEMLNQRYKSVSVVKSAKGTCADCGMIVRPKITGVKVNKLTMQSTVTLDLDIYDANSKLIDTISAKGKTSFLSAACAGTITASYYIPFFGNAVGGPLVKSTLKNALDKALADANEQLTQQSLRGGSLARSWLPKKHEFGDHEYVAEKTARNVGCNSRTDGVTLIEKRYTKETYQAVCYGIPEFTIVCEYGRCNPQQDFEQVAATPDGEQSHDSEAVN